MAEKTEKENKKAASKQVTDRDRFRYIGFEVFPGKPKDLFKSEKEKDQYIESIRSKRTKGELIRDHCTLTEDRVTWSERIIMTLACAVILASLFLPWFSAYTEIVEETAVTTSAAAAPADSLTNPADSMVQENIAMPGDTAEKSEPPIVAAVEGPDSTAEVEQVDETPTEEIITGVRHKKKITKEYERLSGLGTFASLGSVGGKVFSGGFILILTGIIFMAYLLLSIALPIFNLYNIYGLKGSPDEKALKLKRYLKLNWLPVILFVLALFLSFFGADYSSGTIGTFSSLGESYGPGVFLDSLSWGIFLTISGFVMLAVKGVEI